MSGAPGRDAVKAPAESATLSFDDNALLSQLFGEHDRHLARIEQSFDVKLASRGNVLAITGQQADAAKKTVERLYDRLTADKRKGSHTGISAADVDAAIRFAGSRDDGIVAFTTPSVT